MAQEDNPWVKLIKWSNEEEDTPTRRWNGFQLFWADERGDAELAKQMRKGTYREGGKAIEYLSDEELAQAKSFFEEAWDFSKYNIINFYDVQLDEKIEFDNAFFSAPVWFYYATFSTSASFRNVTFSSDARFGNTAFLSYAWFNNTTFSSSAFFENSTFSSDAWFGNATFSFDARFNNATFSSYAKFPCTENQTIRKISFRDATFEKHPPEFYGRTLHEDTDFDFNTLPPIPAGKDNIKDHINAYERLRIQAEGLGMFEARRRFITAEMACRTAACDWGIERVLRQTYGGVSNYGTSVWRPVVILLMLWLIISAAWCGYVYFAEVNKLSIADAVTLTLGKMLPFIGASTYLEKNAVMAITQAPSYLKFATSLFSVSSLALLFLFGLGLRSKFRVGG